MSTQDFRKLSSVLQSIELIEEKTNLLYSQYTSSINGKAKSQLMLVDDSNVHLQLFFQHLEQLLQIDLRNRLFALNNNNNNNKRNYWNFFALALKESKGLYDTVLYVLNNQDVKTSTGRGRLFLRFCLQSHRLGDVIQQSFMMNKTVNQFYSEECFWSNSTYMNRIVQALYQLTDLQFDLLSSSQYQLDVCWPTIETIEPRVKTLADDPTRIRNESSSSILSMNSVDPQSIVSLLPDMSDSIPITSSMFRNLESSSIDESSAHSLSSIDEDPENTLMYWKEKCLQLEIQLQELQSAESILPLHDVEIQCVINEDERINNPNERTDKEQTNKLNDENAQMRTEMETLNVKIEELKNTCAVLNEQNEQCKTENHTFNHENEQLKSRTNTLTEQNEQLKTEMNILREEISNLNFQLSAIAMQRSTTADKIKGYERDIAQYQTLVENKEIIFNELQQKLDKQTKHLQSIQEEHLTQSNKQKKRIEVLQVELEKSVKSVENERASMEKERKEFSEKQEQLEASLQERTLDFEEMKRRLLKAVREKAELFNSIHNYEMKLEEKQIKKQVADEDIDSCMKCNTPFGWTVRRHHCRQCQKIFCNQCSNNWIYNSKTNAPQYRVCDYCNEKLLKNPVPNKVIQNVAINDQEPADDDLRFEVRSERLSGTKDSKPTS